MKGNAILILLLLCVAFAAPDFLLAQNNTLIIHNGIFSPESAQPVAAPGNPGDVLEFLDGSLMHGELKQMDPASGILWDNPLAKNPIDLQPAHLDSIHFAHAAAVALTPASELHFANGDDVLGTVTSLDDEHLGFRTWFGGTLNLSRAAVQSITFLSSNYTILYEGPDNADGWIVGGHNPESWAFRDGAFVSESPGSLGRDFNLSDSSTIAFDLAWSDVFELFASIYSDASAHLDFPTSYLIELRHDQYGSTANLRYIDTDPQVPLRNLGSASLPIPAGKNKARITIQSNKEEGTVAIFVNNVLARRWKDEKGFSASGGSLFFQEMGRSGMSVKLSNFKISAWQGRYEPENSVVMTNLDVIRFINHDQAMGKITGIHDSKLSLAMGETSLQIPIQRVTQINFAAVPVVAATRDPWEVRAWFPSGGNVSFRLEKWSDGQVSGMSPIFGPLAFQSGQIRQLEFNIDRPNELPPPENDQEFDSLDE